MHDLWSPALAWRCTASRSRSEAMGSERQLVDLMSSIMITWKDVWILSGIIVRCAGGGITVC